MASGAVDLSLASTVDLLTEIRRRYAVLSQPRQNVVVFGTPLAGKWTAADALRKTIGLCHIDWSMQKSKVDDHSDEAALQFVKDGLMAPQCRRGFLLQGFPETADQAEKLDGMLKENAVEINTSISLTTDVNAAKDRAGGRMIHADSGRRYHMKYNPPREAGLDDVTKHR